MNKLLCFGALILSCTFAMASAHADQIPIETAKALCASGDVGPRTTYGETKDEAAAKKIQFNWTCMTLVDGKVKEAFEKYVSKDFCDHSHMANAGLKPCYTYDETLRMFSGMAGNMTRNGKIEFPTSSTVNGELVTQYGAGADIWRVHEGKIMDHWDGSPPVTVTLEGHDKAFSDRMQKQIDTGKRQPGGPMMGGAGGPPPAAPAPGK